MAKESKSKAVKFPPLKIAFNVPIYGCDIRLVVAEDAEKERLKLEEPFSDPVKGGWTALCLSSGNEYVLLFYISDLTHGSIAHEVFHLTHRMMDTMGAKFVLKSDEPFAYLCEWLTDVIYEQLERHGVDVSKLN